MAPRAQLTMKLPFFMRPMVSLLNMPLVLSDRGTWITITSLRAHSCVRRVLDDSRGQLQWMQLSQQSLTLLRAQGCVRQALSQFMAAWGSSSEMSFASAGPSVLFTGGVVRQQRCCKHNHMCLTCASHMHATRSRVKLASPGFQQLVKLHEAASTPGPNQRHGKGRRPQAYLVQAYRHCVGGNLQLFNIKGAQSLRSLP